jgi:Putative lumazine-binding
MKFHTMIHQLFTPYVFNVMPASASADSGALAQIENAIKDYFNGHATGDPKYFRAAFLPTAHIEGNRDGKFESWTIDLYCDRFKSVAAPDEAMRRRVIDYIDISGDSAMVKATLSHGEVTFTDYFVMLKVDGVWKIANKVYFAKR